MTLQTEGLRKKHVGHKLSTDVTWNGRIPRWNSDRMITLDFHHTLTERMFDIFKPTAPCDRGHGENNKSGCALVGGGGKDWMLMQSFFGVGGRPQMWADPPCRDHTLDISTHRGREEF